MDGSNSRTAAQITAEVDGTPGTNDMPGILIFSTVPDNSTTVTERLRINASGYMGINTSSPARYLHIVGIDGATGATIGNSDTTLVLDNKGTNGAMIEFLGANNGAGHLMFTDTDGVNRGRISSVSYTHLTLPTICSV